MKVLRLRAPKTLPKPLGVIGKRLAEKTKGSWTFRRGPFFNMDSNKVKMGSWSRLKWAMCMPYGTPMVNFE